MEAELFGAGRGNAALVVANTRAMTAAASIRPPLSLDSLLSMHRALLESSAPDDAGALRCEPVWIGGSELSPAGALFVPPRHERVPEALEDLEIGGDSAGLDKALKKEADKHAKAH